ncbi:hypothetical protein GCM10025881_05480 [Pseudolysinimonas kribbensis]|uniref:Uncharacterized protein n=1 Tax=Pseudolysinimonas kribbensis TaxID=433641 RepID=A0ABQ6K309_9MICO|nr:hypothetical protein [Pseudolysinimonas kribbensis]GMA93724.1 hypothetical protein GCM10025881_05480 [Pseudolysinimonas kribbensis]
MAPDDEVDSARPLRRVAVPDARTVLVDDTGPVATGSGAATRFWSGTTSRRTPARSTSRS